MDLPKHLPEPTPARVRDAIKRFDRQGEITEAAISRLLTAFPSHTDPPSVLLKVVTINRLYSTAIYAVHQVAEMIVQADLGTRLAQGDPAAVEAIRRVDWTDQKGMQHGKNIYSFATKYCTLHNPRDYAMYDGLVAQTLWDYQKRENSGGVPFHPLFEWEDLRNFSVFKAVVSGFRERFGLQAFTLREVDKFLWMLGKGELLDQNPGAPGPG